MAKLNAKQKQAFTKELQNIAYICKFNMDSPDDCVNDAAHRSIVEVIRITKLLLNEISIHEFIVCTKDKEIRYYYQGLIDLHMSPGQYKKKGYGPNHGKVGPKKKTI